MLGWNHLLFFWLHQDSTCHVRNWVMSLVGVARSSGCLHLDQDWLHCLPWQQPQHVRMMTLSLVGVAWSSGHLFLDQDQLHCLPQHVLSGSLSLVEVARSSGHLFLDQDQLHCLPQHVCLSLESLGVVDAFVSTRISCIVCLSTFGQAPRLHRRRRQTAVTATTLPPTPPRYRC